MIRVYDKYKKEGEDTDQTLKEWDCLLLLGLAGTHIISFSARYHSLAFMVLEMGRCRLFSEKYICIAHILEI